MIFYKGNQFILDDKKYTITGSRQLRKKYFYSIKDEFGKSFSINREELLAGISEGLVRLIK